jgi:hypothetical protein
MSKSKTAREQTQALRRRGQTVPKKTLDNGDRFIDGLEFANAFGVSVSEFRRSPRSRRVASEFRRFGFGVRRSRRFASEFRRSGPSAFRFRGSAF